MSHPHADEHRRPPLAIAHDYLTQRGGAGRVVLALHRLYPEAPIHTLFYEPEATFPEFRDATIITSPLNRIGPLRRDPRKALPLLPWAASQLRVDADRAVVSTSGWAHGFRFTGRTVVYCHTPARWVHLLQDYVGGPWWSSAKGIAARALRPMLEPWDQRAQSRHEVYVANSSEVQGRIARVYGRDDVKLVFPPHSVEAGEAELEPIRDAALFAQRGRFILCVARLLPYKNVDAVIRAAEALDVPLLVIGRGPEQQRLRALAGDGVVFAQDVSDAQLRWAYAHADALVAASYEDFGITPLEASAWGVPTVALRGGGYLDTIREGVNGTFVDEADPEALAVGIRRALQRDWDPAAMREHAAMFSERRFMSRIRHLVEGRGAAVSHLPAREDLVARGRLTGGEHRSSVA